MRLPPVSTLTDTLFPYTELFRSPVSGGRLLRPRRDQVCRAHRRDVPGLGAGPGHPSLYARPPGQRAPDRRRPRGAADPGPGPRLGRGWPMMTSTAGPMIGVRDLHVAFGHGAETVKAVDGVSFEVAEKERSEEHTSELQSLMRISYAVFCLTQKPTSHILLHY